jgi:hypothetical protein
VALDPMPDWAQRSEKVIQAAGMISVQVDCSLDDAVVLMNERAEITGQSREEIAAAVVERRIRFA